jgi:hypothetical protein
MVAMVFFCEVLGDDINKKPLYRYCLIFFVSYFGVYGPVTKGVKRADCAQSGNVMS